MATYTITLASGSQHVDDFSAFEANEAATSTLTVAADGYLVTHGEGGSGALLFGTNWTVNVNGAMGSYGIEGSQGRGAGLLLAASSTNTAIVNVGVDGVIFGLSPDNDAYGLATYRNTTLTNRGNIESTFRGFVSEGVDTNVTINNIGRIQGSNVAVSFDLNQGVHKLTNSGLIESTNFAIFAGATSGKDEITNSGKILGKITVGGGDDKITNSGEIDGNIDLGDGKNTLTNSNEILGNINGGKHGNTITNSKVIIGNLSLGEGDNKLTNSGSINGSVVMLDGADEIYNSGSMAGGDIYTGFLIDRFTNTSRGQVSSKIYMQEGDDWLSNAGYLSGTVSMGSGNDTVINSGSIYDGLHMNDGDDIVTNTRFIEKGVSLGDGNNRLTNSGQITSGILGGKNVDTIINSGTIVGVVDTGGGNDIVTNSGKITVGWYRLGDGNDKYTGGSFEDFVQDGNGSDEITLGAGNDTYYAVGSNFVDGEQGPGGVSTTQDGADKIDGGAGIDTYDTTYPAGIAEYGYDTQRRINLDTVDHTFDGINVKAQTASGTSISGSHAISTQVDTILNFENVIIGPAFFFAQGEKNHNLVFGNAAANKIVGHNGQDSLFGFGGNDYLDGGSNNDILDGGAGNDTLDGFSGNDELTGGLGKDTLMGGAGDDIFRFLTKQDSGLTAATRDVITDFQGSGVAGGDVIDLSAIVAKENGNSADPFTIVSLHHGFGAFSVGNSGQLRFQHTAAGTIIWGETTGDGKADFSILVSGIHHFDAGDFVL